MVYLYCVVLNSYVCTSLNIRRYCHKKLQLISIYNIQ